MMGSLMDCALDVEDELLLGLAEHEEADEERDERHAEADQVLHKAGECVPHHDAAEVRDVVVHGVELHDCLHPVRKQLYGVEDGRQVGPGRHEHAPQVHDVAEEHGQRRDEQAEPGGEQEHVHHQEWKAVDDVDARKHAEPGHDGGDRDERDGGVHEFEHHLLEREDI